jgi:predicted nucleic acid-binding protein
LILVDSSIWIDVLRERNPLDLDGLLDFDEIVTCLPVIQEVLQGIRDERAFRIAREAMFALPIVEDPLGAGVFEASVDLYRTARRQGVSVRSSVDCVIAACAIRNELVVFHRDRDFEALSRVSPLRTRRLDSGS